MLISKTEGRLARMVTPHDGAGTLESRELLEGPYAERKGFLWINEDTLQPGTVIGEHEHRHNDELYFIVSGAGTAIIDGVETPVEAGDVILTRHGHRHGFRADAGVPVRIFVAACRTHVRKLSEFVRRKA